MTKLSHTDRPRTVYAADCPTRQVLDRIANKWTVMILGILRESPERYGDIVRAATGITPRVLTRTLRDLERDRLIERDVLSVNPPAVEYRLSRLGEELDDIVSPLRSWSERRFDDIDAARTRYDRDVAQQDRTPWRQPKPASW